MHFDALQSRVKPTHILACMNRLVQVWVTQCKIAICYSTSDILNLLALFMHMDLLMISKGKALSYVSMGCMSCCSWLQIVVHLPTHKQYWNCGSNAILLTIHVCQVQTSDWMHIGGSNLTWTHTNVVVSTMHSWGGCTPLDVPAA